MNPTPHRYDTFAPPDERADEIYRSERDECARPSFASPPTTDRAITDLDRVHHLILEAHGEALRIGAEQSCRALDDAAALSRDTYFTGRRWARIFQSPRVQWRVIAEATRAAIAELVEAGCPKGVRQATKALELAEAQVKRREPEEVPL